MSDSIKEISVHEFEDWKNEGRDFQLVDVREPFEREIASLGGDLIPLSTFFTSIDKLEKEKPVVVYCRSGARSGRLIEKLGQMGYKNLYNLKGGTLAYSDEIDPTMEKY